MTQPTPIQEFALDVELSKAQRTIAKYMDHAKYLESEWCGLQATNVELAERNARNAQFIKFVTAAWAVTLGAAIAGWAK